MEAAAGHLLPSGGVLAFLARPGRGGPGRDVRGPVIMSQSRLLTKDPGDSPGRRPDQRRGGPGPRRGADRHRRADPYQQRLVLHGAVPVGGGPGGPVRREGRRRGGRRGGAVARAGRRGAVVVAEAFRNAVRHRGASCVQVALTCPPLRVVVQDDRSGFDPFAPERGRGGGGFGLMSMRERPKGWLRRSRCAPRWAPGRRRR